ncbi:hypothetical protein HPB50_019974 [Hyalomma asiaticum]|uniref:Uncharacterized protein n=1 Tax=Hyalomma asiaticum TaxID=266040 RepID=A0ACB7SRP2_HYAAI|nr:hypothetical protein HPB50_019974 [Hyalomma asiaticum]
MLGITSSGSSDIATRNDSCRCWLHKAEINALKLLFPMAENQEQKVVLVELSRRLVQKIDRWEGLNSAIILGWRILEAKKPGAFVQGDGRPKPRSKAGKQAPQERCSKRIAGGERDGVDDFDARVAAAALYECGASRGTFHRHSIDAVRNLRSRPIPNTYARGKSSGRMAGCCLQTAALLTVQARPSVRGCRRWGGGCRVAVRVGGEGRGWGEAEGPAGRLLWQRKP